MKPRTRRIAFILFATALFVGTHIPDLRVTVAHVQRPDLAIHLVAFGSWFLLLLATELLGPWRSLRAILLCVLIAGAYAAADEFSQALPGLNRTAAWDDLSANLLGITLAAIGAFGVSRMWPPRITANAAPVDAQTARKAGG